jgi:hypothetical protein
MIRGGGRIIGEVIDSGSETDGETVGDVIRSGK